jgi:uncharacterized protein (TIGR03437 family)
MAITLSRTVALALLAAGVLAGAQDRIALPVDASRTIVLKGSISPRAQAGTDQGRADPDLPISYATLQLQPAAGLDEFLADQQNPRSPNYHRWLTPEQFGERFGLSVNDLARIQTWLRAEGFQIHDVARGRHWITFSGTAGQAGRAFHTEIHRYLVDGKTHFANSTEASVPAALAGVVAGIRGLDDFRLESQAKLLPVPGYNTGSGGRALAPADFATIFDLQKLYAAGIDGTGQSIAILGQTGIHLSDIENFRQSFGLAPNDPQVMLFGPNPGVTSDLTEADLDLEWSGAVARNATIIYAYSSSVFTAAQYAVDQNLAPVMSLSYYGCETYNSIAARAVAQQANAQGITWFTASGDSGAVTCDRFAGNPEATLGPTIAFPANMPEITAVGGTEFTDTSSTYWGPQNDPTTGASALKYVPEKAWNDFGGTIAQFGTGGGPSALFAKPSWQTGPGVANDNSRDIPDISLPASGTVPYLLIYNGSLYGVGGTSASSPAFAGILALVNQHVGGNGLGNINPALYRLAQSTKDVFHDITVGDNKAPCEQSSPGCVNGLVGFSAGTGYDMTTGLGSVDGYNLAMEWTSGTSTNTSLTVSPNTPLNLSDTVQLSAIVTGSGTPPTGTVTFLNNDIAVGSAPLTVSSGIASATVSMSAILIASGDGRVTAVYGGDSVYNGSQGSATINLNVQPGAALVVPFVIPTPVYEDAAYADWPFGLGLVEQNGVATSITSFTFSGSNSLSLLGANPKLPAYGSLGVSLAGTVSAPPANIVLAFGGTDANGNKWTQQLTVPFLPPLGTQSAPGILLTSPMTTVQQNPQADPSCQWALPVALQETGGYPVTLSSFSAGLSSLTPQIQTVFGTYRLAPYGVLRGTVCFSGSTPPTAKSLQISGTSSLSTTVSATLATSFTGASAAPAVMTTAVPSVSLAAASQGSASATVPVNFASGSPQWTSSVSPANRTSAWLTVSPTLAGGSSPLNVRASAAGLSPGVYNAVVSIQALDALPQVINIPVTFVVGGSSTTQIAGLGNAFSGGSAAAPGMILSVYGTQLANSTAQAVQLPLPFSLAGVSATVNGFSAPLYYVSPGQINLQVPYEAGAGQAVLAINNNGQIASYPFQVAVTAPGLVGAAYDNSTGAPVSAAQAGGPEVLLAFVTGEGDVTPTLATGATPASTITDPTKLPHPRLPLTMTIGGVAVTSSHGLLFDGIPSGLAGTTQIDFQVPANVPTGKQPVVVTVGGVASPPIFLNVTASSGQ